MQDFAQEIRDFDRVDDALTLVRGLPKALLKSQI